MTQNNNDYFADLLEGEGPQKRTVEHKGKTKDVYFRRITGAERVKLARGQRVKVGTDNTMDLDISDMLINRHQLVQFCNVTEDGKQVFARVEDVQALPDWLVTQLAKHADDVNKDVEEADAEKQ